MLISLMEELIHIYCIYVTVYVYNYMVYMYVNVSDDQPQVLLGMIPSNFPETKVTFNRRQRALPNFSSLGKFNICDG